MLDELLRRVSNHTPHTLETDGRFPEAAVLVPITRSDEPELILTCLLYTSDAADE